MFRMLIQPSSGACDLFVELFHGLYCSGSMRVGVTVCYPDAGSAYGYHTVTPQPNHNITELWIINIMFIGSCIILIVE